ncbi:ribosomal protein S18-alanine N-acetyltransferase [Aerococcaceae bacterium NML180378]|nr:ribosomal protein S18-alanine N-acetyltransferase [Aerococcaceae bacterium NML180378]
MTMLHLTVVPFQAQQLPEILREQISEANQTFGWTQAQSQADFANEYAEYYVLLQGTNMLGYLGLHRIMDEATINMIYILPSHRQKGLATDLLSFVLEQLAFREVKHLFLEVRARNIAAQRLYQKLKFQPLTVRKNYYQQPADDAVIMQLALKQEGGN